MDLEYTISDTSYFFQVSEDQCKQKFIKPRENRRERRYTQRCRLKTTERVPSPAYKAELDDVSGVGAELNVGEEESESIGDHSLALVAPEPLVKNNYTQTAAEKLNTVKSNTVIQ